MLPLAEIFDLMVSMNIEQASESIIFAILNLLMLIWFSIKLGTIKKVNWYFVSMFSITLQGGSN